MSKHLPAWVQWVTSRGIYGYKHRVVEWRDGKPYKTACGRAVGDRWRETTTGIRCFACLRSHKGTT